MASHMDPQHRTTLSACRPTAGCACRGTALTAREGGARTSGCRQHSRFDAAETGLIEVPRPKTADRNSPDAPCVIGSSGRGSGFQNLCKQRFPVREAPLDGSGSAGLFLSPLANQSSQAHDDGAPTRRLSDAPGLATDRQARPSMTAHSTSTNLRGFPPWPAVVFHQHRETKLCLNPH
jgi:hypothetical protein